MSNIMLDIHGFNQAEAVKLGLNNDDLLILKWLVRFCPNMKATIIESKPYYWINYSYFLECCPIVNKGERAFARFNIARLINANVLVKINRLNAPEIEHKSGKTSWFGFGENYIKLILPSTQSDSDIFLDNQRTKKSADQGTKKSADQGTKKSVDTSIKDKSIIDSSNRVRACTREEVDLSPILSILPSLKINVKDMPAEFNATKVAEQIKKSSYLKTHPKTLGWFVRNYSAIISGKYIDYGDKTPNSQAIHQHNYSKEQLDDMFPDINNFDNLDL